MSDNRYDHHLSAFRQAARAAGQSNINDLFQQESNRLEQLTVDAAGLQIDLSRHRLPLDAMPVLTDLVESADVAGRRHAMFTGQVVNATERRAVLHVALRAAPGSDIRVGGQGSNVVDEVQHTLARMRQFSEQVRGGQWRGACGDVITDVINVGIGGSQLGPLLACEALQQAPGAAPKVHFLANIDPLAWTRIARQVDPATTLVVIASKSWKTIETARNASAVREWLLASGISQSQLARHLVGVTANPDGAKAFGLSDETIFPFSDWVGGRYSMWSAIGLPIMLHIGPDAFDNMLAGARAMDEHFASAPSESNAPLLMALLSLWNADALGSQTEAVIPYSVALARLPAYLQQLQMESNGKSVDTEGRALACPPAPVIWGEPGTDAQHSFFQSLHQSPQVQPVDFIVVPSADTDEHGRAIGLAANALAQAEALLVGAPNASEPHKRYSGNRPSTTIFLPALSAHSFGALIALYEHKTAALGWLMRINSFDQWGVELGKNIAGKHEAMLTGSDNANEAALNPSIRQMLIKLRG